MSRDLGMIVNVYNKFIKDSQKARDGEGKAEVADMRLRFFDFR